MDLTNNYLIVKTHHVVLLYNATCQNIAYLTMTSTTLITELNISILKSIFSKYIYHIERYVIV